MINFILESYPEKSRSRNFTYLVQGCLIALLAYLWLEYTQMDGLFKSVYPLIIAVIATGTQYLAIETGARYWVKKKGPFRIRMTTFWGVSFIGVLSGFLMVYLNAQCLGIEKIYPDIFYFYTQHPSPQPQRISIFYKLILIPWIVAQIIYTQQEFKKRTDKELETIKQINQKLQSQPGPDRNDSVIPAVSGNEHSGEDSGETVFFELSSSHGKVPIAIEDIGCISAADHYCELTIKNNDDSYKELTRLTIKEAITQLPGDIFIQVHRSHIVNLNHVDKIIKKGQTYRILMKHSKDEIPASRHRAQDFLPKFKKMLMKNKNN